MGLEDFWNRLQAQDDEGKALRSGLTSMGLNMMAAGGRTYDRPVSAFSIIGQAGLAGTAAYDTSKRASLEEFMAKQKLGLEEKRVGLEGERVNIEKEGMGLKKEQFARSKEIEDRGFNQSLEAFKETQKMNAGVLSHYDTQNYALGEGVKQKDKALELDASKIENEAAYQKGMLDFKNKYLSLQEKLGDAKLQIALTGQKLKAADQIEFKAVMSKINDVAITPQMKALREKYFPGMTQKQIQEKIGMIPLDEN